jgi:hypothetical protein
VARLTYLEDSDARGRGDPRPALLPALKDTGLRSTADLWHPTPATRPSMGLQDSMIATQFKSKLRNILSYPIGAQAISEAFDGLPQVAEIHLRFYDTPGFWKSNFDRALRERKPYGIFVAEYRFERRVAYSSLYPSEWSLTVYPVLRELRHTASRLLREQGLASVVLWMKDSGSRGWLEHSHRLELLFDPVAETLTPQCHDFVA